MVNIGVFSVSLRLWQCNFRVHSVSVARNTPYGVLQPRPVIRSLKKKRIGRWTGRGEGEGEGEIRRGKTSSISRSLATSLTLFFQKRKKGTLSKNNSFKNNHAVVAVFSLQPQQIVFIRIVFNMRQPQTGAEQSLAVMVYAKAEAGRNERSILSKQPFLGKNTCRGSCGSCFSAVQGGIIFHA